jgi:hypothetical protein
MNRNRAGKPFEMKRYALVASAVAALVSLLGAPSLAKGPDVRVSTRAVITGPGLNQPIVVQGDASAYGFDGFDAPHNDLSDELLRYTGLSGADVGWYVFFPDPHTLGPEYKVTYTFMGNGSEKTVDVPLAGPGAKIDLTIPFRQIVYPYAPERPLVYTPPDQVFLKRQVIAGNWWSAPPALRSFLISKGLPSGPMASPAQPVTAPERPWVIAFAATALLAMVVMAAVVERRVQRAGRVV